MKTLILLRHAKSSWDDATLDDHDRPLAPRGERAAGLIAAFLHQKGILPDVILCSTARRTRETLARVQAVIGDDAPALIERDLYLAPAAGLLDRLRRLGDDASSVMLIGHNPGMEDLAGALVAPTGSAAEARMAEKFPTAGLAVIRSEIGVWSALSRRKAALDLFVIPKDLV